MDHSLLIIAALAATAIAVGHLAKRFVPEVVVFLALGVATGPQGIGLINEGNLASLELVTEVALGMIIFLIGDRLRFGDLAEQRWLLVPVNLVQILLAGVAVFFAVQWAGARVEVAILLAMIATESGVLTVTATVKEERAAGPTTDLLLSSLGVTNVVTALLFGLSFPFVLAAIGDQVGAGTTVEIFARLVLASAVIGLLAGWVLKTFVRGMETSGELMLFLVVVITGAAGAATAVGGSVVVASLIAGLYVANAAPWLADRLFAAVRALEAPIYLVFFVVAGAGIHLDELARVGAIGGAYVLARGLGKVAGGALGGMVVREAGLGLRTGVGLLPHAGMAIALVALVVEQAPELGGSVSGVVLGSIVVFELGGPFAIRQALRRAGEKGKDQGGESLEVVPEVVGSREFDKVLVPVGGVEMVLPRLPFLLDLVGSMRADLIAVHVSRPGDAPPDEGLPDVLRLVHRVAAERNINCTCVSKVDEVVSRAIVAVAQDEAVDLIVMGEPARTSLLEPARWGLVSQRVVRDVDVPVLVYPVDPSDPERVPSVYLREAEEPAHDDEAARGHEEAAAEHQEAAVEHEQAAAQRRASAQQAGGHDADRGDGARPDDAGQDAEQDAEQDVGSERRGQA